MPQTRCNLCSELGANRSASFGFKSAEILLDIVRQQLRSLEYQPEIAGRGWIDLPEGLKSLFSL